MYLIYPAVSRAQACGARARRRAGTGRKAKLTSDEIEIDLVQVCNYST